MSTPTANGAATDARSTAAGDGDRPDGPDRERLTTTWLMRLAYGANATTLGVPARLRLRTGPGSGPAPSGPAIADDRPSAEHELTLDRTTVRDARMFPHAVIGAARTLGCDPHEAVAHNERVIAVMREIVADQATQDADATGEEQIDFPNLDFGGVVDADGHDLLAGGAGKDLNRDCAEPDALRELLPADMRGDDRFAGMQVVLPEPVSPTAAALASLLAREVAARPGLAQRLRPFDPLASVVARMADNQHASLLADLLRHAVLPRTSDRHWNDPRIAPVGVVGGGLGRRHTRRPGEDMDHAVWSWMARGCAVIGLSEAPYEELTPELVLTADHHVDLCALDGPAIHAAIRWTGSDPDGTGNPLRPWPDGERCRARLDRLAPQVTWRMLDMACAVLSDGDQVVHRLDALVRVCTDGAEVPPTVDAGDGSVRRSGWRPNAYGAAHGGYDLPDAARAALGLDVDVMRSTTGKARSRPVDTTPIRGWAGAAAAEPPDGPALADLAGYGAAGEWGTAAAADLRRHAAGELGWADMDCHAVLLSGPPGTGKTQFAFALARSAGVRIVASSVADWQSADHLGHTLRAIRRTFEIAREAAPVVLFVDEIDGIGSRETLSGDYTEYWEQVVNELLTQLDGAQGREGVLVVAATNHPGRIDPAIRRSGRLDRHIAIARPDEKALEAIFAHYLGDDMLEPDTADDGGSCRTTPVIRSSSSPLPPQSLTEGDTA